MNLWLLFWEICLWVAGAAFAFITVVVTFRGFRDLRDLFGSLGRQHRD